MRIAVVGAGIAGISCAQELTRLGHQVVVLDRGRVPGGQMASRRFDGRYVDMGASYFTVADDDFQAVVSDWEERGLARQWTDTFAVHGGKPTQGPMRWASPSGIRSLVTDLAAGLEVRQQIHVERVTATTVDGEPFDRVVLALPTGQAQPLTDDPLPEVAWEAVLVLAARWAERTWEWDGLFVNEHDVLTWIADDGARRGDGAPVLTAHSTSAFASTRLPVPADAAPELVDAVQGLGLPAPAEVYRCSGGPTRSRSGSGDALFALTPSGIGLCGDGFGSAKVETAWLSGRALARSLEL